MPPTVSTSSDRLSRCLLPCLLCLIMIAFVHVPTWAGSEETATASVRVPFARSDLESTDSFQPRGDRFVVSWHKSDQFWCSIVDAGDGSTRTIGVYPSAKRPALVGDQESIYAAFGDDVEGSLDHRVYDLKGNMLYNRIDRSWMRPTPSGRYLVRVNSLLRSSSFGVFNDQLRPLEPPPSPIVDSKSWDAIPVSDSFCLVRNGRTVMRVSLPELTVLSSRDVSIDAGFGILGLYCDPSGSTIAVTNYMDVVIVNMSTGDTYGFREDLLSTVVISQPCGPVFTLNDKGDGHLTISQHEENPSSSDRHIEIDLRPDQPGFIFSHLDTAYSTSSHLIVNYTVVRSCEGQDSSELNSILITRPISPSSDVAFIDGPSWVAGPKQNEVYSLQFHSEGLLSIERLQTAGWKR